MNAPPALEARGVTLTFQGRRRLWTATPGVTAVLEASLALAEGEILGLVGESASGKTSLARLLVGAYTPTAGQVLWQGRDLQHMAPSERQTLARQVQMVFQDPYSSLNPRKTVWQTLAAPLRWHGEAASGPHDSRLLQALAQVQLPAEVLHRYPHQFSGGQRQRIGLARALILQPRVLVLDEPLSALDVSVQAQMLNLLSELQRNLKLSLIFVSHDLATVRWLCDRVAVMSAGRIVETAPAAQLFAQPQHPYTRRLLAATLSGRPDRRRHPLKEEEPCTAP